MNKINSNDLDRIADYIAYSEEYGRGEQHKFSIETGDTLTVNISALDENKNSRGEIPQTLARQAL